VTWENHEHAGCMKLSSHVTYIPVLPVNPSLFTGRKLKCARKNAVCGPSFRSSHVEQLRPGAQPTISPIFGIYSSALTFAIQGLSRLSAVCVSRSQHVLGSSCGTSCRPHSLTNSQKSEGSSSACLAAEKLVVLARMHRSTNDKRQQLGCQGRRSASHCLSSVPTTGFYQC